VDIDEKGGTSLYLPLFTKKGGGGLTWGRKTEFHQEVSQTGRGKIRPGLFSLKEERGKRREGKKANFLKFLLL